MIPSATITSQCHRLQGSRSSRLGMSVVTVLPVPPVTPSALMDDKRPSPAFRLRPSPLDGEAVSALRYTPPARGAP